jgi:hypothetical protein
LGLTTVSTARSDKPSKRSEHHWEPANTTQGQEPEYLLGNAGEMSLLGLGPYDNAMDWLLLSSTVSGK